jgi:single-strand DNA-binding protein
MLNNVVLAGRLTKDPELRFTPNGTPVSNFTIAVQRDYKNESTGEYEADFFNCVAWRETGERIGNMLKKGSFISVIGKLETRNYEAQDGKRVYVTEINVNMFHFLEKKESSIPSRSDYPESNQTARYNQPGRR